MSNRMLVRRGSSMPATGTRRSVWVGTEAWFTDSLQALDADLKAKAYEQARHRLFLLVTALDLREGSGQDWYHLQPSVCQHVPRLYRLLVSQRRPVFERRQADAIREGAASRELLAFRRVRDQQLQELSEALYSTDRDERVLALRELSRVVRHPSALTSLRRAQRIVERYRAEIEAASCDEIASMNRRREQERRQRERQALRGEQESRRVRELEQERARSRHRAHALEEQLQAETRRLKRVQRRLLDCEAELDASTDTSKQQAHELSRLRHELELSRERLRAREAEVRHARTEREHEQESIRLRQQIAHSEDEAQRMRSLIEQRAETKTQRLSNLLELHRREMEAHSVPPADETYGLLLASLRASIKQDEASGELPLEDDGEVFAERAEEWLTQPDAGRWFSPEIQEAIRDANRFVAGILPYAETVRDAGFSPDQDRDELVLAFVENRWRWSADTTDSDEESR